MYVDHACPTVITTDELMRQVILSFISEKDTKLTVLKLIWHSDVWVIKRKLKHNPQNPGFQSFLLCF